jgi:hypothetical protein
MAHCPYELLQDLEPVLEEIRKFPKIKETKPGIFYFKGQGFLHFHINKENKRWADVRDGQGWVSLMELPFPPTKTLAKKFLKEVQLKFEKLQ